MYVNYILTHTHMQLSHSYVSMRVCVCVKLVWFVVVFLATEGWQVVVICWCCFCCCFAAIVWCFSNRNLKNFPYENFKISNLYFGGRYFVITFEFVK